MVRMAVGTASLFEFCLVQVATASEQPLAYVPLKFAKRGPVGVVVVLDNLKGPPVLEHIAPNQLRGQAIRDLVMPGLPQRVDRVTDLEVSLSGELVERVQVSASPLDPLQRLGEKADRIDCQLVDTFGALMPEQRLIVIHRR